MGAKPYRGIAAPGWLYPDRWHTSQGILDVPYPSARHFSSGATSSKIKVCTNRARVRGSGSGPGRVGSGRVWVGSGSVRVGFRLREKFEVRFGSGSGSIFSTSGQVGFGFLKIWFRSSSGRYSSARADLYSKRPRTSRASIQDLPTAARKPGSCLWSAAAQRAIESPHYPTNVGLILTPAESGFILIISSPPLLIFNSQLKNVMGVGYTW